MPSPSPQVNAVLLAAIEGKFPDPSRPIQNGGRGDVVPALFLSTASLSYTSTRAPSVYNGRPVPRPE